VKAVQKSLILLLESFFARNIKMFVFGSVCEGSVKISYFDFGEFFCAKYKKFVSESV